MPGFSERSRQGRRNRQKGAEYERDVANAFKQLYTNPRREHGQARDGGDAPDVSGTPFWIECTKGEASIYDKLEQGLVDSQKHDGARRRQDRHPAKTGYPVLVCARRNGKRTRHVVVMDRDQFIEMLECFGVYGFWSRGD